MSRSGQKGQALVEWAIFGTAILVLWCGSMQLARRLLARTAVDSWSLLGARHALSATRSTLPPGLRATTQAGPRHAASTAALEGSSARFELAVPGRSRDRSPFSLSSFGSLFSLFSE